MSWVVAKNGMPGASIHVRNHLELPGYFRPAKRWDLIVVHREQLVAAIEFKSQVGQGPQAAVLRAGPVPT